MKFVFVVILLVLLSSCTVHFKGKDVQFDSNPVDPQLKLSNNTYQLDSIDFFKKGT